MYVWYVLLRQAYIGQGVQLQVYVCKTYAKHSTKIGMHHTDAAGSARHMLI